MNVSVSLCIPVGSSLARHWSNFRLPVIRQQFARLDLRHGCWHPNPSKSAMGNSDAANKILKSGVASERFESGVHPDPWYSSGALEEGLLQRLKGLFILAQFGVSGCDYKTADVVFFRLFQCLI